MGKASRDKGARFELAVAKLVSAAYYDRSIRRVPLSGGLDIKSDLYDPEDDSFPLFVECKYRESYRWSTVWDGTSPLYATYERTSDLATASYLSKKYREGPTPVVVFKGGEFPRPMVLVDFDLITAFNINDDWGCTTMLVGSPNGAVLLVCGLPDFLKNTAFPDLVVLVRREQEDDGYPD